MPSGSSSRVEDIVRAIMAERPSVVAAYLFGSTASGHAGPLSDIDVAVLLSPGAARQPAFGDIEDGLCRALRTERLDVVSLNEAPASLAYRVIRDGRLVFCRDRRAREAYESGTVMRYLDFKPLRDRAFLTGRAKILGVA